MEEDALAVGVGFKLAANGHHHVEGGFVAVIEVILHGMVKVERETVAGLVAVGQRHGGRAVGTTSVVPLNAVG